MTCACMHVQVVCRSDAVFVHNACGYSTVSLFIGCCANLCNETKILFDWRHWQDSRSWLEIASNSLMSCLDSLLKTGSNSEIATDQRDH